VLAIGALAAGLLAVVLVTRTPSGPPARAGARGAAHARSSASPAATATASPAATATASPAVTASASPDATASASPSATATASPPVMAAATPGRPRTLSAKATVRAFYRRAAAGDFPAAWRLAGPRMRLAFGDSFERFRTELSSLRHVEFEKVEVVARDSAGATHVQRVDHCSGTVRTVRGRDGRWLLEPNGVSCTSA
jgi:hypothetical protein